MGKCKNGCGEVFIIPPYQVMNYSDPRISGEYCSSKCVAERRASLPKLEIKIKEKDAPGRPEDSADQDAVIHDPTEGMGQVEADMWKNIMGE